MLIYYKNKQDKSRKLKFKVNIEKNKRKRIIKTGWGIQFIHS